MARRDKLRALNRYRAAASRIIRLAQFLADTLHGSEIAFLVAEELHRIHQHLEVNALVLGVMDLFPTGWHLHQSASVKDTGGLRAQAQRAAHRVHCGVAAADHNYVTVFARVERLVVLGKKISPHQVYASKKFVGRIDTVKVLSRDLEEAGQPSAGRHADR